jgi:hypothetical protein
VSARSQGLTASLTIHIPPELDAWLKAQARGARCSKSELLRIFIRDGLRGCRSRGFRIPRRVVTAIRSS